MHNRNYNFPNVQDAQGHFKVKGQGQISDFSANLTQFQHILPHTDCVSCNIFIVHSIMVTHNRNHYFLNVQHAEPLFKVKGQGQIFNFQQK